MTFIFFLVLLAAALLVVAWNFVPAVRDRLKGWTTVLEALLATSVYWFGQVSDALKEAQAAGYIPTGWLQYLPYIFMVYLIVKRLQIKGPVGRK